MAFPAGALVPVADVPLVGTEGECAVQDPERRLAHLWRHRVALDARDGASDGTRACPLWHVVEEM